MDSAGARSSEVDRQVESWSAYVTSAGRQDREKPHRNKPLLAWSCDLRWLFRMLPFNILAQTMLLVLFMRWMGAQVSVPDLINHGIPLQVI